MGQEKYEHNALIFLNGPQGFHGANVTKEMFTLKTDCNKNRSIFHTDIHAHL